MTVADEVAAYLGERCPVVFGIIGAGNMSLFDAIARLGRTTVVCCHHEQAAVMAALGYYRICGTVSVVLVTTGAGSSNALTGVLSALMDSIPVVVLAGNEPSMRSIIGRAIGVQGYDSTAVAREMTGFAVEMRTPEPGKYLPFVFKKALEGRPRPVWLTIPMDVASATVT